MTKEVRIQPNFKYIITTFNMTENNCDDVTKHNNHNKNYTYVGHNYSNPLQVQQLVENN
jgi:hypothetical protein